jgi:integron integrase
MPSKPGLLDQVRDRIRVKHYSLRTEQAYVHWIKRFIFFHGKRHPKEMSAPEVEAFLSHLDGRNGLMGNLLYGSGLRLMEVLRLRVKDVDFEMRQITVRDGKGFKDRVTMLPESLIEPLKRHLEKVREIHKQDLQEGFGEVFLPFALERKYPNAGREWGWQYVFPASQRSIDPCSGKERRHHLDKKVLQRVVKETVRHAGLTKPASCHTMRNIFEIHLLQSGYDIRTVHEFLGHKGVSTTMIYSHVLNRGGRGVMSPLDRI